jgi:hypothetical protein
LPSAAYSDFGTQVTSRFDGTSFRFFAQDGSPVERESSLEKPMKQDIDYVKVFGLMDLLSHAKSDHPDIEKVFGSAKTAALRHLAHHLPDISSPFSDLHAVASVQEFCVTFVHECWQRPKIDNARRVCDAWQRDDRLAGLPLSPQAVDAIRQWTEYRWERPSLLESGNFEPDEEKETLALAPTASSSGPAEETDTSGPVAPAAGKSQPARQPLWARVSRILTNAGSNIHQIVSSVTGGSHNGVAVESDNSGMMDLGSSGSAEWEWERVTASGLRGCSPLNNLPLGHRLFDPKADGADELAYLLETSLFDYLTWLNNLKVLKHGRNLRKRKRTRNNLNVKNYDKN